MTGSRSFYAAASVVALVVAASVPATAHAAEAVNIDIAAQPLSSGVLALSEQSDATIMVSAALLGDTMGRAVKGRMSAERALREMLRGTPFRVKKGAGGALIIVRGGDRGSNAGQGQGKGALVGRVVDAATQRRLEGARIAVRETGQSALSDERGEYRIADVPTGNLTLDVGFIGYDAYSESVEIAAGGSNSFDIRLGAPQDIVVYASKSARALALNKEKAAENSSTVISSDLLGNFNGTTISEALRRAPGVAFQQDEKTGTGTNIIVRGLSPDYNQVKLNGIALPETSGAGRAANLGNILADSVSEITINKTLLANQDSAGTGGLVEIETKSPLDRPARYYSLAAEYNRRGKGFGDDSLFAGTVSHRFGAAQTFGLSASVQYRTQKTTAIGYEIDGSIGPYLPLDRFGNPAALEDIDPRTPYPFEEGVDAYYVRGFRTSLDEIRSNTLSVNLAAEWQVSDATNLKFDLVRSRTKSDSFSVSDAIYGFAGYTVAPVPALGGEDRYVLNDSLGFYSRTQDYGLVRGATDQTTSYSFRGTSKAGALTFAYKLGHARGRSRQPWSGNAFLPALLVTAEPGDEQPEIIDPVTGVRATFFGRRVGSGFQLPLMTTQGLSRIDPENATFFGTGRQVVDTGGGSTQYTASGSARYDLTSSLLRYIEVGFDYNRNRSATRPGSTVFYDGLGDFASRRPGLLGFAFNDLAISRVSNVAAAARFATEQSVFAFVNGLDGLVGRGLASSAQSQLLPTEGKEYTREEELAGYVQGRLDIGKVEVIGGVRFSQIRVNSAFGNGTLFYAADGTFDQAFYDASLVIVQGKATQFSTLPRVLVNWRPSEDIVMRAGYFMSIARPQVRYLTSMQSVALDLQPFYGPNGNQPQLNVGTGNPDLKPARTHNFDLSAEYYMSDTSVLKASAFYKRIDNLLENNFISPSNLGGIELPDDPRFAIDALPDNLFVLVYRPVNNPEPATIWGFELSAEQQLNFLPGFLSGLGIYANYTYTKSSKSQPVAWYTSPVYDADGNLVAREQIDFVLKGVPFDQQPRHSGTAGLRYSKYGIDASLLYSYQARRKSAYQDFQLDRYAEAVSSLDLHIEYKPKFLGGGTRVYIEGNDLLHGARDLGSAETIGGAGAVPKYYTRGIYRGGRSVTVGASISF